MLFGEKNRNGKQVFRCLLFILIRMRKIVLEDPTNVHASTVSFTRTSMSLHKFGNKGKGTQSMEELEPPICLNLPVVGHSFPPGS
jgi:hypothetical protein